MKVILSRKGMDSAAGGIASPILPDGTLLSLPIPDNMSGKSYSDLYYKGQSFQEIIRQLSPRFNFDKKPTCHLDPDIYDDIEGKCNTDKWKPAFGQQGIPAAHLDKLRVDIGDIFLFYGMFRETEGQANETIHFVRNAPIRHIIYGYMEVGEILREEQDIKHYDWHPHSATDNRPHNRLYLPSSYGTFQYEDSLVLTKQGQNRRQLWSLPAFFAKKDISVSWQGKKNRPILKGEYAELNSACRGQEFVVTASTAESEHLLSDWVHHLIQTNIK